MNEITVKQALLSMSVYLEEVANSVDSKTDLGEVVDNVANLLEKYLEQAYSASAQQGGNDE